jgi:tRNA A-37 threonylcarbamoyl transferase component Bud32
MGDLIAGRYEVDKLVGRGGMSSVFKAHDTLLERDVALKVLHEHHLEDKEYVERFQREARIVAQLSHPNIVTVIDRGEADGRPFIVFEYVDGQTLDRMVSRRGALPIDEALEIAIASARGLAFAHRHGLVHRDVKPQNILLNGDREPKVTDFGIARSLDVQKGVTQTGTVLGTSNYIAPEQASGDGASVQSDVYSLGVVLFELLTGDVPFEGENFVTVAMKHINEPAPSVSERRRDVPPRLAAAVSRALAKNPRDRFPSMESFAAELEACLAELGSGGSDSMHTVVNARAATPVRRRMRARRRFAPGPLLVSLLALAALALIVVAAVAVHRDHSVLPGVSPPKSGGGSTVVRLNATAAYDPEGDGGEHDSDAQFATDGDQSTYWRTDRYASENFGNLKTGVGLVLGASGAKALKTLTVTSDTPGFAAVVKAGGSAGTAQIDSGEETVGGKTTFDLKGHSGSVYVLWITRLAPGGVAHVNGVTATS